MSSSIAIGVGLKATKWERRGASEETIEEKPHEKKAALAIFFLQHCTSVHQKKEQHIREKDRSHDERNFKG
jgi:hypothetical protein